MIEIKIKSARHIIKYNKTVYKVNGDTYAET